MTVPELMGALAIACFFIGFGTHIVTDLSRRCREGAEEWRREWPVAQSRPYDRKRDAA